MRKAKSDDVFAALHSFTRIIVVDESFHDDNAIGRDSSKYSGFERGRESIGMCNDRAGTTRGELISEFLGGECRVGRAER